MNPRVVVLALTVCGAAVVASPAQADPQGEAAAHVEAAQTAHAAGDYAKAYDELKAAYALDPQPDLLFAQGQVLGKLDRCKQAIGFYKRFLATQKERDARAITQQAIDACKTTLAKHHHAHTSPEADPDPDTDTDTHEPPTPPPPPGDTTHPFYTDVVGDALVGGGVVAGIAAAIAYSAATGQLDDADAATTLADYQSHVDAAHTRRVAAVVLVTGGVVLVTAGIIRFALHRDPDPGDTATLTFAPNPSGDGGILVWQGGW